MDSGTSTLSVRSNRIPVQGSGFFDFLVQVRMLVAHCDEAAKVAAFFIMFSAVTAKLN